MKVGLQLYSIREEMEKDMDAALKAVKEMGYDYVEFAGYFGKTAEEVAALLEKYQLKCRSVHQGYSVFLDAPEENVQFLKKIGAECCAIPWMDPSMQKGQPGFEQAVKDIAKVSALLKENGIQMLYHNHDFEFKTFEGKYVLDWLYETLTLDVLKPEIDTCWVNYAGCDPCEYITKYSGQIKFVHLKDYVGAPPANGAVYALIDDTGKENKTETAESTFEFRPVGQGVMDFPAILAAAEKAGAEYVIVEQDQATTASPLESAAQSRAYLRSLGL